MELRGRDAAESATASRAASGTEMQAPDGVLSGVVSRYFDEHDKLRFVEDWCAQNGYSMSQVAAIGDSRSDVPLFQQVGMSIALNATPDARAVATHVSGHRGSPRCLGVAAG